MWRSPVAHLVRIEGARGSNPLISTVKTPRSADRGALFWGARWGRSVKVGVAGLHPPHPLIDAQRMDFRFRDLFLLQRRLSSRPSAGCTYTTCGASWIARRTTMMATAAATITIPVSMRTAHAVRRLGDASGSPTSLVRPKVPTPAQRNPLIWHQVNQIVDYRAAPVGAGMYSGLPGWHLRLEHKIGTPRQLHLSTEVCLRWGQAGPQVGAGDRTKAARDPHTPPPDHAVNQYSSSYAVVSNTITLTSTHRPASVQAHRTI